MHREKDAPIKSAVVNYVSFRSKKFTAFRNSFNRDERAALLLIMSYFTQDSRRVHLSAGEKQRQFIAF